MKKKLFAAAISLAIATIMMTSASFAWFTISTQGEVEGIDVTMEGMQNLEIAKATDLSTPPAEVGEDDYGEGENYETWGSTVAYTEASASNINFPATINEGVLQSIPYNEDDFRTLELADATAPVDLEDGVGTFTFDNGIDDEPRVVADIFGVWVRSNYLEKVKADYDTGDMGDENPMKDFVRVRFATYDADDGWTFLEPAENETSVEITLGEPSADSTNETLVGVVVFYEGETRNDKGGVLAKDMDFDDAALEGLTISFTDPDAE